MTVEVSSIRRVVVLLMVACLAAVARAGEIQLTNGDRLAGELISISESSILWNSATVGNLKIAKDQILAITSTAPLKIRGRDEPCYWQELRGSQVIFACANGDLDFEPLYSLKQVVPYVAAMEDFYQHDGHITLSGSRFGGNVEQQSWLVDTELKVRYSDVRHTIETEYEARSFADTPLDESYELEYFFDWFFAPRGYWQNETSGSKDESRNIQERYAFGSGLGYELWRTPIALLSFELGGRFEKTIYEVVGAFNPNREYSTEIALWRSGFRFNYRLPLEIDFRHQTQYFQPVNASDEWRFESDTGFSVPLGFGISANVSYEYDYNNAPPEFSLKKDSILRFGLDYSW